MQEIAMNSEDIRYYKNIMTEKIKELDLLAMRLHHQLEIIPESTTDKDHMEYVNRINVESIKQSLFITLLEDYASLLDAITDKYEDTKLKVDTILNQ
mgnify:CR=1 FL=1|jgi:hypothetical protein